MEKKPNIMSTPWEISMFDKKRICTKALVPSPTMVCEMFEPNSEEFPDTAQAIVTAVNCTYGANINPEKIQELIAAYTELVQSVPFERFPYGLKHRAEQALNNIKYQD